MRRILNEGSDDDGLAGRNPRTKNLRFEGGVPLADKDMLLGSIGVPPCDNHLRHELEDDRLVPC